MRTARAGVAVNRSMTTGPSMVFEDESRLKVRWVALPTVVVVTLQEAGRLALRRWM